VNGDNTDEIINTDTSKLICVADDGLYFAKKVNLITDKRETKEKLFAHWKSIIPSIQKKKK